MPMTESLLSFSNIDLFGHLIAEFRILDPNKKVVVDAATTEHMTAAQLSGNPTVDNVHLQSGMLVLVWRQENEWQNGIYKVGAATADWKLRDNKVQLGRIVKSREGALYKNSHWIYDENDDIRLTSASFTIPTRINAANPASIDQIAVDGVNVLSAPVVSPPAEAPEQFAKNLVAEVNKELLGRYTASAEGASVTLVAPWVDGEAAVGRRVVVTDQNLPNIANVLLALGAEESTRRFLYIGSGDEVARRRRGENRQLERQLKKARCARIYGFSYEGSYYDLPRPVVFLVHGDGDLVTADAAATPQPSRAPRATSLTGFAAAEFEFSDSLRVWSYDKADYTIRMDVETGMFEQVLLDAYFGGEGGGVSGAKVSGAKVSGAKVSGARVSGAKVSGAKLWGGRDASD